MRKKKSKIRREKNQTTGSQLMTGFSFLFDTHVVIIMRGMIEDHAAKFSFLLGHYDGFWFKSFFSFLMFWIVNIQKRRLN